MKNIDCRRPLTQLFGPLGRCMIVMLFSMFALSTSIYAQCDTCMANMVANETGDNWSDECYLKDNCTEQGNPCQANDVNLVGAFIANFDGTPVGTCMPGDMVSVALWGQFLNGTNTNRYAVRTTTDVLLGGECQITLNGCSFDLLPPGDTALALLGTINYICGESIQLQNTWVAWETSFATCTDPDTTTHIFECGDYSPSKCSKEVGLIDFLSPNFDFACGEITSDSTEVCFMNLTTGGMGTLTYFWDFGDGNTSMEENPCHTYFNDDGPAFTVILNVIDTIIGTDTVQAGAVLVVDLDNLGCCILDIVCPNPLPAVLQCLDEVPLPSEDSITIIDMCGMITVMFEDDTTGTGCVNDTLFVTRSYYICDNMMFMDTCVQVFSVVDNTPPSFVCPADTILSCNDDSNPMFTGMPSGMDDNCAGMVSANFSDSVDIETCTTTIFRTWTVMDDCGNTATCVQEITLIDDLDPICPTPPADITYSCVTLVPPPGDLTATDDCQGDTTVTGVDIDNGGAGCPGDTLIITRTWTFNDGCGNSCAVSQEIRVVDDVNPVFDQSCPNDTTVSCDAIPSAPTLTASDNCGEATVSFDEESTLPAAGPCLYEIVRTWVAVDECGNSTTCSQVITVVDTTPPMISCPADLEFDCGVSPDPDPNSVVASDNCGGEVTVTWVGDVSQLNGSSYIVTRTYRATDVCGNAATCTQILRAICLPEVSLEKTVYLGHDAGAGCPGAELTSGLLGTPITYCFIVTNTGNEVLEFGGFSDPVLSILETDENALVDLVYGSGGPWPLDPGEMIAYYYESTITLDTCNIAAVTASGQTSQIQVTDSDTACVVLLEETLVPCGPCTISGPLGTCPSGLNSYTVDVDACMVPVYTWTVNNGAMITSGQGTDSITVTAVGLCDTNFIVSVSIGCDSCTVGTSPVECMLMVVVEDLIPPSLSCPDNLILECGASTDPAETGTPTLVSDNCSVDLVTFSDVGEGDSCDSTVVRTWSVIDDCGNVTTCVQRINLIDTIDPVCPAAPNDTLYTCVTLVPSPGELTATDACQGDITATGVDSDNGGAGCSFDPLIITRTWLFPDGCGNSCTVSQTIIVADIIPPTITCPDDVTFQCMDDVPPPADPGTLTATDNCGTPTVTFVSETVAGTCPTIITRTYKATDDCMNMTTCIQTITVDDTTPPTITCPDDVTVECFDDVPVVDINSVIASDNCGDFTVTHIGDDANGPCPTEISRGYRVTDLCGNSTICVQTIIVNDTTAPAPLVCPPDLDLGCNPVFPDDLPPPATLTTTDNCSGVITAVLLPSDAVVFECTATLIRYYRAEDECGNAVSCSQVITWTTDTTPPSLTCPDDVTIEWPAGLDCFTAFQIAQAQCDAWFAGFIASDNCSGSIETFVESDIEFLCLEPGEEPTDFGPFVKTVRYRVVDACGNSTSCTRTFTAEDTTPPVFTAVPVGPTVECIEDVTFADATVMDECVAHMLTFTDMVGISVGGPMSGIQEAPPVATTGTGTMVGGIDTATNMFFLCVEFSGLLAPTTAAHVHVAPPGVSGPVILPLPVPPGVTSGSFCISTVVPDAFESALLAGDLYVNIHTTAFPAGEIRGQLDVNECEVTVKRTWIATDDCDNTSMANAFAFVIDTTPPTVTCPEDVTVECFDDVPPVDINSVIASDNCGEFTVTHVGDDANGPCPTEISRGYRVTDLCGNSTLCIQTIIVNDTTAPAPLVCPPDVYLGCNPDELPPPAILTTVDNCSGVVTAQLIPTIATLDGCEATLIRLYRATDDCGNSVSCTQVITWTVDTTPPTITCPADVSGECVVTDCVVPDNGTGTIDLPAPCPYFGDMIIIDGLPPGTTIEIEAELGNFTNIVAVPGGALGGERVTYDATLQLLLTGTGTLAGFNRSILIPLIQVAANGMDFAPRTPGDPVQSFDADLWRLFGQIALVGDPDFDLLRVVAGTDFGLPSPGHTTLTRLGPPGGPYDVDSFFDITFRIDFVGNPGGALSGMSGSTTGSDRFEIGGSGVPAPDLATATDNCDQDVFVTFLRDDILSRNCPVLIHRFYIAEDDCGNSATCSQVIFLDDTTPPASLTCPENVDLGCNPVFPDDLPPPAILTTVDNCSGIVTAELLPSDVVIFGCTATLVRYYRASDECGNSVSCSQVITWTTDMIPPSLTIPDDLEFECDEDVLLQSPYSGGLAERLTVNSPMGIMGDYITSIAAFGPPLTTSITANIELVNDGTALPTEGCSPLIGFTSGNIALIDRGTCMFILKVANAQAAGAVAVIVVNNVAGAPITMGGADPAITIPSVMVSQSDGAALKAALMNGAVNVSLYGVLDVTVSDNCDPDPMVTFSEEIVAGNCASTYQIRRTYTATDACGNVISEVQIIDVADTTPPVISCPAGSDLGCSPEELPLPEQLTAIDNCDSDVEVSVEVLLSDTIGCLGILVYEYSAMDDCGNIASCTQTYTYGVGGDLFMQCTKPAPFFCPEELPTPEFLAEWLISEGYATVSSECSEAQVTFTEFFPLDNNCALAWTFGYTATDGCGNQADTCYIIIQIYHDDAPPVITCSDPPHLGCNPQSIPTAQQLINAGFVTATDACGPVSLGFIPPFLQSSDGCEVTRQYRYRATDGCGNQSAVCTVTVQWFDDLIPPSLTCPADLVLECDDPIPAPETATATDNCEVILVTFIGEVGSGDNCDSLIVRTYYAIDACGNEITCTQQIRILDTTGPVIVCPEDLTLECNVDPIPTTLATATDNCVAVVDITYVDAEFPQECDNAVFVDGVDQVVLLIVRTHYATDGCDNISSCTQHIIIRDDTPPEKTCPEDVTIQCHQDPNDLELTGVPIVSDLCDPEAYATILVTFPIYTDPCSTVLQRVWIVTDECGNGNSAALCQQLISIVDTTPPEIICPEDATVECGDPTDPEFIGEQGVSVLDNCDPSPDVTYSDSFEAGCGLSGVITRTWIAADDCGNSSSCTQYIVIEDTTPPSITCPENVTIECGDALPTTLATALDICGSVTLTYVDNEETLCGFVFEGNVINTAGNGLIPSSGTGGCTPITTFENSVSGLSGGSSVIQVDIDLSHTWTGDLGIFLEAPNGERLDLTTGNGGSGDNYTNTTFRDDAATSITSGSAPFTGTFRPEGSLVPFCSTIGTIPNLAGFTPDQNGTWKLIIEDNALADIGQMLNWSITFTGEVEPCCRTITRTHYATDECGNVTVCVQRIDIVDTTPPTITCPDDLTIECGDPLPVPLATADDICDDDVFVTLIGERSTERTDGSCLYSVIRTYRAEDDCGLSTSCTQVITVEDTTPPDLTCPEDYTITCGELTCLTFDDVEVDPAGDPVDISTYMAGGVTIDIEAWAKGPMMAMPTLFDTENPAPTDLDLGTPNTLYGGPGISGDDPDGYEASNNQARGKAVIVQMPDAMNPFPDDYLLSDSLIFTFSEPVFVVSLAAVDFETPQAAAGAGIFLFDENGASLGFTALTGGPDNNVEDVSLQQEGVKTLKVYYGDVIPTSGGIANLCFVYVPCNTENALATDACNGADVNCNETIRVVDECLVELIHTYSAVDECGNASASCTQTISVETDTEQPEIQCPDDLTFECGSQEIVIPAPDPGSVTATDNCTAPGDILITWVQDLVDEDDCESVVRRIYSAEDECGNVALCVQYIRIVDTTPPAIVCPVDATIECGDDLPTTLAGATDICNDVTLTYADSAPEGNCPMVVTRTHYATDVCGNTSSCTQYIYIEDTTAPVIICAEAITIECGQPLPTTVATATDLCNTYEILFTDSAPAGECPMVVTRTFYATDACENVSSCTQYIYIEDTTPPSITCPEDLTLECNVDPIPTTLATASDICDADVTVTYSDVEYPQNCDNGVFVEGVDQVLVLIVRTHVATDNCGNTSSCTQHIVIRDDTPPQVTCVDDVTIECDQDPNDYELTGIPILMDLCDPEAFATISLEFPVFTSPCSTVIQRVWIATDACGNGGSGGLCPQLITILDTTPPSITCPDDVTIECGEDLPTTLATGTDNCGQVLFTYSDSEASGECPMVITRTHYASDGCGNVSSCTQYIYIDDTTPPVLGVIMPPPGQQRGGETFCDQSKGTPGFSADGDCEAAVCAIDPFCCDIAWDAICADETSLFAACCDCSQTPDPQVCASVEGCQPLTVECGDPIPVVPPIVTDNCDPSPDLSYVDNLIIGECPAILLRSWYAEDACGNVSICNQVITIVDTTPPVISCPADISVECGEEVSGAGTATATDMCDDDVFVTVIGEVTNSESTCSYTIIRTYEAVDNCGNSVTCTQVITVEDTTPPEVSCPMDQVLGCDDETCLTFNDIVVGANAVLIPQLVQGGITIDITAWSKGGIVQNAGLFNTAMPHPDDLDLGTPNTLYGGPGINGDDPDGYEASNNRPLGNIAIVQQPGSPYPDDHFLSDSLIFTFSEPVFMENVVVMDFEIDQINTGAGIFLFDENGALISFVNFLGDGNDNSMEEVVLKQAGVKVMKMYYGTAIPGSGGVGSLCFVSAPCNAEEAMISDICNEATLSCEDTTVVINECITQIIRTYSGEDLCGNVNEGACTQTLTLQTDGLQPDIICPADLTLACEDPLPAPDPGSVVATDNCTASGDIVVTWIQDIVEGFGCAEEIRRIYQATDECGNVALCAQFITRVGPPVQLQAKVMLGGSMNAGSGDMYTLINNLLPEDQPYWTAPANYPGPEEVELFPPNIVDWVLVELRDVITMEPIAKRSALVTSTGDIVDLDGISPVMFTATPDQYYVVICHRNHLDVLSDAPVDLSGSFGSLDFTLGNSGMIQLGSGMWALIKGDVNSDGLVNNTDLVLLAPKAAIGYSGQYLEFDVNMDGLVNNTDLVILAPFAAIGYAQGF